MRGRNTTSEGNASVIMTESRIRANAGLEDTAGRRSRLGGVANTVGLTWVGAVAKRKNWDILTS